jgi:hypothetical protein
MLRGWSDDPAVRRERDRDRARLASKAWRFSIMATEFYFTPGLHLKDGRIIRDLDDATDFARDCPGGVLIFQRKVVLRLQIDDFVTAITSVAVRRLVTWRVCG